MAKKILVVDDESDFVMVLESRLKANGYEVLTADNGIEGFKKAKSELPDLIILDVMLPQLNGYSICRMLKFDAKYKDIPVIMLTAKGQETDKAVGEEVAADAYFVKPFESEKFLEEVKRLLSIEN